MLTSGLLLLFLGLIGVALISALGIALIVGIQKYVA